MSFDLRRFRGVFPAALTMFDREGNLDEEHTARHWEWLIHQGVDGLVIAGTSGEFIALESEERVRLFRLACDVARGRLPVVLGSGAYSTRQTIRLSEAAEKAGTDALIVILPYFQKPPKAAVFRHFREVRRAVGVPIMLYNNPANSACADFTPREVAALVEEDVVHMVKSTYESVVPVHDLAFLVGDKMAIFYGSFQAALEGFAAGADGWISGLLNVAPRAAQSLYRACVRDNDLRLAARIWRRILPLVHLYTHQQVGPVSDLAIYRAILDCWGLHGGHCRSPFYDLDDPQVCTLRGLLERSGWLDPERALEDVV